MNGLTSRRDEMAWLFISFLHAVGHFLEALRLLEQAGAGHSGHSLFLFCAYTLVVGVVPSPAKVFGTTVGLRCI